MFLIGLFLVAAALTAVIVWPIWFFWLLWRTADKPSLVPWSEHFRELQLEWIFVLLSLPLFALGVMMFIPATQPAREASRRVTCINNCEVTDLHDCFDAFGSLPPANNTTHPRERSPWA